MAEITAVVMGGKAVMANLKNAQKKIEDNLYKALQAGAFLVEGDAKKSIMGTRKKKGDPHTPSSPGQPPAVVTGKLRASITKKVKKGIMGASSEGFVGVRGGTAPDTKNYGYYLEFGTPRGQMLERPFLRPALRKNIRTITGYIKNGVKKVTK